MIICNKKNKERIWWFEKSDANVGTYVGLVDENSVFKWKCSLIGPRDIPYANGIFYLTIIF